MQVTFTLNVGLTSVLMRAHRCVQYLNNVRALYKKKIVVKTFLKTTFNLSFKSMKVFLVSSLKPSSAVHPYQADRPHDVTIAQVCDPTKDILVEELRSLTNS